MIEESRIYNWVGQKSPAKFSVNDQMEWILMTIRNRVQFTIEHDGQKYQHYQRLPDSYKEIHGCRNPTFDKIEMATKCREGNLTFRG